MALTLCLDIFYHADRKLLGHHFIDPPAGLYGRHFPVCGAVRQKFDEGEADVVHLVLESLFDGPSGLQDICWGV